jgi:hypothetical protein
MESSMTAIKRTARWGAGRIRNWSAGLRGSRDMARRYLLLARLANLDLIRRGFSRHVLPRAAAV